jgi:hypothetical protein
MNTVRLPLLPSGSEPVLAGRLSGQRGFVAALEQLPEFDGPALVALDFSGVDLATSSYLSAVLIPLRDHLRLRHQPGYAVAANLGEQVREEVDEMLRRAGEVFLVCTIDAGDRISDVDLCGKLDDKLEETLKLVSRKQETTAAQLHEESRETDPVGATAWNNRLASLAAKSLVVEILQGRTKKYRPVLEVV